MRRSGEPPRRSISLFVLGDSISIQYGPFLEQLVGGRFFCDRKGSELLGEDPAGEERCGILQRLSELDSDTDAINGGDSAFVLAYLKAKSLSPAPGWTVLLLNCGLHDLRVNPASGARQVEPERYAGNLEEILSLAARLSRWVVWLQTTPVADARHQQLAPGFQRFNVDVRRYNQIAQAIMDRAEIPVIDLYDFTCRLSASFASLDALYRDHVHFVEPVQRLQAAYIAGWLDACQFA